MSNLDFTRTTPGYQTTPEDRARGFLRQELVRAFPTIPEEDVNHLAHQLAAELTTIAARYAI